MNELLAGVWTFAVLGPIEIGCMRKRRRHVEPQGVRQAPFDQLPPRFRDKRFCRARIERRPVRITRPRAFGFPFGHQARDVGTALEGGIDQALAQQFLDRVAIHRKMFGLPAHRPFPGYPEPFEVLIDRGLEFRDEATACAAARPWGSSSRSATAAPASAATMRAAAQSQAPSPRS